MRIRHTHYVGFSQNCDPVPDLFVGFSDGRAPQQWLALMPPSVPMDTSEAAAERIRPSAPTIREALYAVIAASVEGMTAGELEARTAYSGSTIRPRLRELQGTAPWAKGRLPARIVKTLTKRGGMRVYQCV